MTNKISGLPPISSGTDLSVAGGRKAQAARPEALVETDRSDGDRVELTPHARVIGGGGDAPVDGARVDALRRQIADGSYRIDAQRIAGKLLDLERVPSKD
jgi:negative regulator of flagellin synthesis FlgM